VEAWIVVYTDLDDTKRQKFQFPHQFHTDGSTGRAEPNVVEQAATYQSVVTVDVTDSDLKQKPSECVISTADQNPVPRVLPLELVAIHQPDVRRHLFQQPRKLEHIVLTVTVGVEDQVFLRCVETCSESPAIASIVID
jgi:hypothetical protein